jgi:hypothetical protein
MIRTVISLEAEDKQWLEEQAKINQTTFGEIVRQAVKRMRLEEHPDRQIKSTSFELTLSKTQGIWQGEDGLNFQQSLREEWSSNCYWIP